VAARPDREQFGFWREVICEAFVPLTPTRKGPGDSFSSRVETRPLARTVRARIASHTGGRRVVAAVMAATWDLDASTGPAVLDVEQAITAAVSAAAAERDGPPRDRHAVLRAEVPSAAEWEQLSATVAQLREINSGLREVIAGQAVQMETMARRSRSCNGGRAATRRPRASHRPATRPTGNRLGNRHVAHRGASPASSPEHRVRRCR
jgi:hypothetical protein